MNPDLTSMGNPKGGSMPRPEWPVGQKVWVLPFEGLQVATNTQSFRPEPSPRQCVEFLLQAGRTWTQEQDE